MSGYWKIHHKLRTERGRAVEHFCECGERARDWALQAIDDPVFCPKYKRWFSPRMSDYKPMCRGCHLKLDRQFRSRSSWSAEAVERHRLGAQKGGRAHAQRMKLDPAYRAKTTETSSKNGKEHGVPALRQKQRCRVCGLITNSGGVGKHNAASDHRDWEKL